MEKAAKLSHLSSVGGKFCNPMSFRSAAIQVISQAVKAIALYSASAVDRATTLCFLDFQEIGELPRRMQNPEVESLVAGQLAQSLSQ